MRHIAHDRAVRLRRWFATFVLPVLPLLFAVNSLAQSGRRTPPTAHNNNSTQNTPEETNNPTATNSKQITIFVARQPTSKHFAAEDSILASFVKRLGESSGLEIQTIGDLKRSEAVKRARAETEALVVFMHFDIDSFQNGTIILNSQDLEVMYSVFSPNTGKEQTKGKVYFQNIGGGRLRKSEWPTGTPIKMTTEAAGIEAADQLHTWLAPLLGVKQRN